MVKGINRANASSSERILFEHASHNKKCVFISHKSEDKNAAKYVGDLLINAGLDIYLDLNDEGLQQATREQNASKIVSHIEKALTTSTNILVLVTEKTKESWWVPYEIGYAKKGKKDIASLLLKNVDDFPDYLEIEKKLKGLEDLKKYSQELVAFTSLYENASLNIIDQQLERNLLNYIRR